MCSRGNIYLPQDLFLAEILANTLSTRDDQRAAVNSRGDQGAGVNLRGDHGARREDKR